MADVPKKSRHVALRYMAVRDHAERLCFVPTGMQRADALTKGAHSGMIYKNVFHLQEMERFESEPVDMTPYAITSGGAKGLFW